MEYVEMGMAVLEHPVGGVQIHQTAARLKSMTNFSFPKTAGALGQQ
jgi:hypothetical protein